jgi:small neutral amino acid transporter SnatA (MarC family)
MYSQSWEEVGKHLEVVILRPHGQVVHDGCGGSAVDGPRVGKQHTQPFVGGGDSPVLTVPVDRPSPPPAGFASRSPDWPWAAALVLALNPARAAFAVPRAGRSPRTVVGVAGVGGVIGGLGVCVAATAGGPLLEALDVSEPSFRLAAGIVAGLAGAADLFRRPPPPEPALAGWRAALVPVAIPVVARPAVLVLALGAGADRGVLVSAGAMAIGIALLTGLAAAWRTEGPGRRVLPWAGRLLAALLVTCGVILAVDGVLDV